MRAMTRTRRAGLGPLDVHRVELEIVPGNAASVAVADRLGFTYEATLKERLGGGGVQEDGMLFRLFARDFRAAG